MSSFVGLNSIKRNHNLDANLNKQPGFPPNSNQIINFGNKTEPLNSVPNSSMVELNKKTQNSSEQSVQENLHTNTSANNNFSLDQHNTYNKVPESPDYRTFLQLRRLHQKKFNTKDDSDNSDMESSDDEVNVTARQINTSDTSVNSEVSNNNTDKSQLENKKEKFSEEISDNKERSIDSVILKVSVPDQKITKCFQVDANETAWTVKLRVIQTLALKLADPLNYGFYCKKLGRFLLDHKPLSEYVAGGSVVNYELLYKRKIYHQVTKSAKETRQMIKMQSSSKQRELLTYVIQRNTDKIYSLIRKGVDPNFHILTEETPLTTAAASKEKIIDRKCSPVIMALVGGGAHLDFRNKKGLTPVHVAARTGNSVALKTMLDLGASPDVLDDKDLSPLYHCGYFDSSVECLNVLIQNGAKVNCVDAQGWTVLHQVCKNGKLSLLQILCDLIRSNRDAKSILDAKNATGNTALHVCALYNQEACLALLLKQGADKTIRNFANQDIFHVAIVAGNMQLANYIKNYQTNTVSGTETTDPEEEPAQFRRHTVTATSLAKFDQPRSMIGTSFSRGKKEKPNRYDSYLPPGGTLPKNSVTTRSVTLQAVRALPEKNPPVNVTYTQNESQKSKTNLSAEFVFIACQDYQAQSEQEIDLVMGDRVTVITERKFDDQLLPEGYVRAIVNEQSGLVPKDYIQAVKLRKPRPALEISERYGSNESLNEKTNLHQDFENDLNMKNDLVPTSDKSVLHRYRDVTLSRGNDGYGFILRGAKSDGPIDSFVSTPSHPALQYLESVEVGSNAHQAGLRSGDYVLQVNKTDVSCVGHRQIVDTIKLAGNPLHMRVVNVVFQQNEKETSDDVKSVTSHSTVSSQESGQIPASSKQMGAKLMSRSGSIGSAIGQLDSVLALEESGEEGDGKNTATLRRRPISRRMRSQDIEEIFLRKCQENAAANQQHKTNNSLQSTPANSSPPVNRVSQSLSSATSRRLIKVLPPKLPKPVRQDGKNRGIAMDEVLEYDNSKTFGSATSASNLFAEPDQDFRPPQFDYRPPQASSFNHSRSTSTSSSGSSVGNSRKPPPAPPQRRSSRLTNNSQEEEKLKILTQPIVQPKPVVQKNFVVNSSQPQQHHNVFVNNSQPTNNTTTKVPPPVLSKKPISGIAAAVAAAAQHRQTRLNSSGSNDSVPVNNVPHAASCPSPVVPPTPVFQPTPPVVLSKPPAPNYTQSQKSQNTPTTKVEQNSSSALLMALAAKRASLKNQENKQPVGNSVNKPPPQVNSTEPKSNNNTKYAVSLPPPPPTPPDEKSFHLPPPPSGHENSAPLRFDELFLPPPPDSMLTDETFPPPNDFAGNKGISNLTILPPVKFKDNPPITNTHNGTHNHPTNDFLTKPQDPGSNSITSNMETMSLGSTLSTMSSEDGSDAGVSLSYNSRSSNNDSPNSPTDVFKKNFVQNSVNSLSLTKVQFGNNSKPFKNDNLPARRDVTKPSQPGPVAEKPQVTKSNTAAENKPSIPRKSVKSWTSNDVTQWLNAIGLGMHAQLFAENEINGSHLPELGKDDLSELGITRLGHRKTIEKSLKTLLK